MTCFKKLKVFESFPNYKKIHFAQSNLRKTHSQITTNNTFLFDEKYCMNAAMIIRFSNLLQLLSITCYKIVTNFLNLVNEKKSCFCLKHSIRLRI